MQRIVAATVDRKGPQIRFFRLGRNQKRALRVWLTEQGVFDVKKSKRKKGSR